VGSFATAWINGLVEEMIEFFAEDADLYYPFSSFVRGRANIAELLREEFAGQMKDSELVLDPHPLVSSQILDRALVEFHARLQYGEKDLPLLVSALLTWDSAEERWSFVSLRLVPRGPRPD
jgi:hypothetical protein